MYLNGKVKNNLEFLVFEFSRIQLNELKKEFLDEIKKHIDKNVVFLRSYEVITGLFTEKMAKHTTETQCYRVTGHVFNVRNHVKDVNNNHIGGHLATRLQNDHSDIINNKKFDRYSIAFDTHKMINFCNENIDQFNDKYIEIRNNQIIGNLFFNKSYKYVMNTDRIQMLNGNHFSWTELKSCRSDSLTFGTKNDPLHRYLPITGTQIGVITGAPNDGIKVYIGMTKNNASKFKKNEQIFCDKYDISDTPFKHIVTNNSN
eukprot:362256_1